MNARFSPLQIGILAILFVCVCCELTGLTFLAASTFVNDSPEVVVADPSPTAALTRGAIIAPTTASTSTTTPAPTNTRVVNSSPGGNLPAVTFPSRTPTRTANPYKIVVPTPTAPAMIHPIAFTSTLAVTTYNVTGKTENDISKSLEANAIADPHEPGSRYYALTKWQLGGNWVVKSSPRGCQVEEGSVSIFITMTLPALATTADVPANVLKKFDSFLDKTILHESDHAGLALQGARDYQRALGNFAPVSDCEGLKAQLNNLFRRSFESIDNVNTDYDIRTQHGRTQGAVFP